MTAQIAEHGGFGFDPHDILSRLPDNYQALFLAEYREAMVAAAHETWRFKHLREVLKLWHLRAIAYATPGFEQARRDAAQGINTVPAEDVIPGWADMVAARADTTA